MKKAMKVRHRKKWWKITTVIVIIFLIILLLASNIMINLALIPSWMEKTQAFETITEESLDALIQTDDIQQNHAASIEETNQWLQTVETRSLVRESKDGYRLVAQVFLQPEEKKSHKWVLLLHGYTGWKEEMYPFACQYAKQGYQILVPDMRCQGESEGDFIGMGWTDRIDNKIWLSYIIEQDPDAEIVLHGQSMGAACALLMAGEDDLPDQVKAVISDCAYSDAYQMFQKQLKEWFHLPAFPLLDTANLMLQLRGGYDLKKVRPIEAVEKSKIPILFIHGKSDEMVPYQMSVNMYESATCEKEILLIEGAGHAQAPDKDPETYYTTIFGFLSSYIGD